MQPVIAEGGLVGRGEELTPRQDGSHLPKDSSLEKWQLTTSMSLEDWIPGKQ